MRFREVRRRAPHIGPGDSRPPQALRALGNFARLASTISPMGSAASGLKSMHQGVCPYPSGHVHSSRAY